MVTWFWVFFAASVVGLVATARAGRRAQRRKHYVLVAITVVLLGVTIALTEALTRAMNLPKRELGIHLWFAQGAVAVLLVTLSTGFGLARRGGPKWRRAHRVSLLALLVAILLATGTGLWVVSLAP